MPDEPRDPPREAPDEDDVWTSGRTAAREQVRAALARRGPPPPVRECPTCSARERTASELCPRCGCRYDRPRRRLSKRAKAALAAVPVVLAGAGLVALSPTIERSKEERAEAERRERRALVARERRRLEREQRALHGRASRTVRATRRSGRERAARLALVHEVERAITTDARARVRAGGLDGPIVRTRCRRFPRSAARLGLIDLRQAIGRYSCLVITTDNIRLPSRGPGDDRSGAFGYPFWAKVDFRDLSYAWCRITPRPGEAGKPLVYVPPPRACQLSG